MFGQTVESLGHGFSRLCIKYSLIDPVYDQSASFYDDEGTGRQKDDYDSRAIILCKFQNPSSMREFMAGQQQKPRNQGCGNISETVWETFEEFGNRLKTK